MKRIFALLFVCLSIIPASSLQGQTASISVPQQSAYGYPWSVLAGSDRKAYVTPIAEKGRALRASLMVCKLLILS